MKCPKCNVDMEIGQAINYDARGNVCTGFGHFRLTADKIDLVDVAKCPKCGHSDDLE